MVPGMEDLLPPPPKKGTTNQVEGELLPPPPKKKIDSGTGDGGGINLPLQSTEKPVDESEYTLSLFDPTYKKTKESIVYTKSPILGNLAIPDEAIPDNILDKKGYRTALQNRIISNTPEQLDLQVIATTTKKPIEAVKAYTQGRDGKGIMIEFDTIKETKATELDNLIKQANTDLGLSDTFDGVLANRQTTKQYLNKIEQAYAEKTEREFNSLNEVVINGKKRILEQDDERYIDKSLPATQKQFYNPIKNRNDQVLNGFKNTLLDDIVDKVVDDETLSYTQKVKEIGDIGYNKELKQITEAKEQRRAKDASGRNELGKLFRDENEETNNLNSVNSVVESRLNNSIKQRIIYQQAALSDIVQQATEKANSGTLTEEQKTTYQSMISELKSDIEEKQKEYKSPQKLQKEYPVLLKQSLIADINEFNAIKSGNVKGYEAGFFQEGGYEGISLKEHLKAQGYDMNSQVVKDVISDAESGVGVKDYSFFGEPIKAIKDVFVSSGKSIGDIAGTRDDVTVLSEKKSAELFPTTIGKNEEYQLTTAASTAQNIANTTGQVIGQGLMQTATAGLGRLAGLSKVAASGAGFWSSGTLTSYDQAYKDAFDLPIESGLGRTTYAGLIALANGASEKIFPESKLFDIPGVKGAYSELASKIGTEGFTDKMANQLLNKAKNAFVDYGQKYASNISKETLEETATQLFESGTRYVFGDPNVNYEQAMEAAKNTAIQTAIGTSLIGGMGVHKDVQQERNIAPVSVIYNAAVYKDEAMDALTIGFKNGLYDEVEYNNKVSLLNTAEVSLSELGKAEKVIGRELTRPQKELFVANSTAQKLLTEQKKEVDNPAIVSKIDEKLKNLQSQQMQLLDNKVQFDEFGNVVVPVKETETIVETPTAEVTTETTTVVPAAEINNSLEGNDQIPAFELEAMKANPETALQTIADQALGFGRVDGVRQPLDESAPEPQMDATVRKYGQEVVDKAIAMFPAEAVEVNETVTEAAAEPKAPANRKERLAAFKNKFVAPPQPTAQEQKQWNELSMGEKLALAKENLPEVDNLTNTEAVKVADQNAKMLLGKLNKTEQPVPDTKPTDVVVDEGVVDKRSDAEIEKRMGEIEEGKGDMGEFNKLEKEMEKRERATVFNVPLDKVSDAVDALMKKEKEQPNGYGSFIERRDATETKEVADKYNNPKDILDADLKNDFKEALMGKPATWYADGLRLRESMKEASNRGIDINDMLKEVEKEFTKDGFSVEEAKKVIAGYLEPIFKDSKGYDIVDASALMNKNGQLGNQGVREGGMETALMNISERAGFELPEYKSFVELIDKLKNSPEKVKAIHDYIKSDPIEATKKPNGEYHVADGNNRANILHLLGIKEIPIKKEQSLSTKPEIKNEATTSQTIKTKSNEVQQKSGSGVQASVQAKKGQGNKSDQKEVKETGGKPKKPTPVSEEKRVFTVTGNQRSATENTVRNKQNKSSLLNKLKDLNAPQALIDNVNAESKILGYNGESLKMFLRTGGFYRDGENDIHINPFVSLVDGRYKSKDRAIVHEAVHLVAFDNVQKYLDDDYANLNGEVIDSLDYINDSLEKAKSNFTGPQVPYGFTNLHEFISEFVSNPAFRNTVARNLDTGKAGLTKILDAIKDFFSTITGIPIKSSLNIDELTEINKKIESVYGERETGQRNNDTNPLFSIQSPTSQEISDMKDIVKDYVDEGTASLQDIQDDVAKELGDNSQEMRDLVEKAYNEFTKDTDFAPKEVTGGVIGKVGKFLSKLFGGTPASRVVILKNSEALRQKAEQLNGDVQYQKSLKDYINIVLTSIALSATPVQTGTTKAPIATEINEGETKTRNTIKKLLTDYYAVNEETVPKEVIDRALKVWERVGRPEILPDSTKNNDRAFADETVVGNITDFDDLVAELAHSAQFASKAQLNERGYATQEQYDAVEYERVGSVEYDAHKIIEPMIAAYILKGKKAVDAKDIDGAVEKYGLKNVLYQFKENDLNLQNESELQKYLPDTLSPTEKQGSIAGGEANAAATVITGSIQAANEAVKGGSNWLPSEKLKNKEGKYLEQHAKETNTWIEEDFGKPDANGFEQDVYLNPDGKTVTKVHSNVTHDTWNDLFHRIAIHNTLFPDVAYTLKGFTKHNFSPYNIANDYRELAAVFEQPLITKGGEPIKYTEVVDELSKLGFEPAKSNEVKKDGSLPNVSVTDADSGIRFINPTTGVEISDLHGENVMRGTDGKIHFIDPIIELTEDRKNGKINFMKNPNGDILGFTHNNIVYLNSERLNTNTPIHEAGGHIWVEWAKTNQPEVYTRGMQLTENSKYLKEVKNNDFYKEEAKKLGSEGSKAYNDYMKHEALAMAIGDKGAQFVGETRKKDFKEWLNNLWNTIKKAAGFTGITPTELQNLTFDEFTKRAVADILREEEQTQAEPELTLKEVADQIRKEEISYNDAIEGKDETFVNDLNKELFGSKKVNFDTDAFKAQVKKQKSFGLTEAEVIEGFEAAKKLTKIQKVLIAEIFAETAETDKVAAELKEAFKALAKGEKPKGVLKRLGVSNVTELVNALRDSLTYNAVSNDQLDAMADFIVDSIDLNKADQYLNALINNSVADVRQILRAKLIVALQKEGNTELATKLISEMADEATVSGRQTQSLKRAYEILGAQGNPATRTEFAKRYAEAVQEKARQMTQDLGNVISEQEAEIGKLNQKIHQKTQDSPLINKIKEVIANLCGLRSKK